MSTIGSFSFIRMTGPQIPALALAVEPINRPAVDGVAFRDDARKVREIMLETIATSTTLAAANVAVDNYAAIKGTLVTIVDDFGRTVNYVMILDVGEVRIQPVSGSSPAGTAYLVKAAWRVKPTQ